MKHVFFTGATGGLGELCVRALSDQGTWLIFAAGTSAAALERLGQLPRVIPLRVDLTCQASLDAAYAVVRAKTDSLDAVINFAGLACFTSLVEGDCLPVLEKLIQVNVLGLARVNKLFFEMLRAGGGRIINCSSESGWMTPQPFNGPYAMTKYAIEAYNDSLRRELMFLGIPVIKIQPGAYKTHITQCVYRDYDHLLASTRYYRQVLTRMKPLMVYELGHRSDPGRLVKKVLQAANARHPRLKYRAGTGKLLALLELLPDRGVDVLYRFIFRRSRL